MSEDPRVGRWKFPLVGSAILLGIAVGGFLSFIGFELEGGAIAVAGAGPLFWFIDRRLNPTLLFGPSIHIYAFHLLGYAIGPLGQRYLSVHSEHFSAPGMVLAQWGALIGLLCFAPVYAIAFRLAHRLARPAKAELEPDDPRWKGYTVTLAIAAVGVTIYAHLTNAFRRLGDFEKPDLDTLTAASAFSNVQQVVFFFLALFAARKRTFGALALWAIAFSGYSLYTFLEGTRGLALVAMILSSIGFVVGGISRKVALLALVLFLTAFIPISAIVDQYRSIPTYASRYDEGLSGRVDAFYSAASDFDLQSRAEQTSALDVFFLAATAQTVDRIMEYTPDRVPFAGFRDLERVVYVWMPKIYDAEHPSLSDGNEIASEYGVGHEGIRSWVYTPTVGEGYRRFGWIGISLVYAFVAVIFGSSSGAAYARRRRREWAALLIFCILQAPHAWSSTLLSSVHYLAWVFPKFLLFFFFLRVVQDFIPHLRRTPARRNEPVHISHGHASLGK